MGPGLLLLGPWAHSCSWPRLPLAWATSLPSSFPSRPHPNSALHGVQAETWRRGWQEIWGWGEPEPGGPLASTKLLSPSSPHPAGLKRKHSSIQLRPLGAASCRACVRTGSPGEQDSRACFPGVSPTGPQGECGPWTCCMSQEDRRTRPGTKWEEHLCRGDRVSARGEHRGRPRHPC